MSFSKHILTLSILTVFSTSSWAEEQATPQQKTIANEDGIQQLDTLTLTAHPLQQSKQDFGVADQTVSRDTLQQGGSTLGKALKQQLGVYSNSFGAGSSRPVIRGQEGARVKVTQNATESMDVSSLSPDHTVTVDQQINISPEMEKIIYYEVLNLARYGFMIPSDKKNDGTDSSDIS